MLSIITFGVLCAIAPPVIVSQAGTALRRELPRRTRWAHGALALVLTVVALAAAASVILNYPTSVC